MIVAERDADRITFIGSPRYKELVRAIPGTRYNATTKTWSAPLSWATALASRGVLGDLLTLGDSLQAWGWDEQQRVAEGLAARQPGNGLDAALGGGLYDYQRTGTGFLCTAEHAVLADEQGTGKTIQAIAALVLAANTAHDLGVPPPLPALVVATNSMLYTWASELETWAPSLRVQVIHGSAAKRRRQLAEPADVYIIGWATLRHHTRLAPYGSLRLTDAEKEPKELNGAAAPRTVIADEAHRAKDPKAKQTRALWQVCHQAEYRWLLTGTPIANSPADWWALGHAIAPEEYPSRTAFIDRYTLSGLNVWGGLEVYGINPQTQAELFGFLDPRFLRRTKAEVLPELPAKTYSVRIVEMEPKQAKAYDQFAQHMIAELDSGVLFATDPLTKLTRLLQLAAATPLLSEEDGTKVVESLVDPSCKVSALLDLLDEAPGAPVVVFAASRKLVELTARRLEKEGVSHVLITGEVPPAERTQAVEQFQEGKAQVCLATLGAGGEGITLTAASRAIFLQRSWSLTQNIQAEDRIHRIGQTRPVEIVDVVTRGTVEDAVHEAAGWKSELLQQIVRDPVWVSRALHRKQGA